MFHSFEFYFKLLATHPLIPPPLVFWNMNIIKNKKKQEKMRTILMLLLLFVVYCAINYIKSDKFPLIWSAQQQHQQQLNFFKWIFFFFHSKIAETLWEKRVVCVLCIYVCICSGCMKYFWLLKINILCIYLLEYKFFNIIHLLEYMINMSLTKIFPR